jgi:hypothetical protein
LKYQTVLSFFKQKPFRNQYWELKNKGNFISKETEEKNTPEGKGGVGTSLFINFDLSQSGRGLVL